MTGWHACGMLAFPSHRWNELIVIPLACNSRTKMYVPVTRFGWIYILKTPSQTIMQFRFKSSSVSRFVLNGMHLPFTIVKPQKIRTLTIFVQYVCYKTVGYLTTRRYANSRIANLRTGQLAAATRDFACLVFVLLSALGDLELSSPRVGNPWVGVSASCPVTKRYMAIMYRWGIIVAFSGTPVWVTW